MAEYLALKNDQSIEIVLACRFNSNLNNVRQLLSGNQVKIEFLELTDMESCAATIRSIKPDYIYHFGALTWVSPSWNMPSVYFDVNAQGTINLLEAVRKHSPKARVLISCTPEEYGDVPVENLPINEETKLHPINPYAASKVAQEMIALTWEASYQLNIVRTRVFNHEGPRRLPLGANASFAYQIAKIEAGLQKPIIEVGNLEALRNFTAVSDVVRAYEIAMNQGNPGELYLIGNEKLHTMKQCLDVLIELSHLDNIQIRTVQKLVRPTELKNFTGDFSKFYNLSDWRPTKNLQEILFEVLNYWRERVASGELYV